MRLCAITNVYNESFNLPIWLRYYSRQVGQENCFIVDDGSDDGSTEHVGRANLIRLPRDKFDDRRRATLVSKLAEALLLKYEAVIYSDADELIVADPRIYSGLANFVTKMTTRSATCVGLNLIHNVHSEDAIDVSLPILSQRSLVRFVSPMCKTLIVRETPSWGGGFHSNSFPPSFFPLYLFHLRHMDIGASLARLRTTKLVQFADPDAGRHHRSSVEDVLRDHLALLELPIVEEFDFERYIELFRNGSKLTHTNRYYNGNEIRSSELFRVPSTFREVF